MLHNIHLKTGYKRRISIRSKKTALYGLGSIFALLGGILILVMWDKVFPYAYAFCEAFLSADHHISDAGNVSSFLFSISISCFVIGLFLLEIWFREPAWYFEGLESIGRHPASFWCGLGVIVLAFLPFSVLHQPEGIIELMAALLLIGSGLVTVFLTAKYQETDRWRVLGVGLVFVFLGMEEISWGQHLFGWQTPEAFALLNDQGETNLHNLDNMLLIKLNFFAVKYLFFLVKRDLFLK